MTTTAITTTTTMLPSPLAVTSEEQEDKDMVEQEMEAVEQETKARPGVPSGDRPQQTSPYFQTLAVAPSRPP
ncbi:unnamed protein product [Lampetra planeri]